MTATPELTRNQALVLSALSSAEAPLSAYTILDRFAATGCARRSRSIAR